MSPDDLDDAGLWQQVQDSVKPIGKRYHSDAPARARKKKITVSSMPDFSAMSPPKVRIDTPLKAGAREGIDRRTAERFTRGKMNIDATIDLHGMPSQTAYQNVMQFLYSHYARGNRCVLVITGKGPRHPETGQKGGGVLRDALPQWLSQDDLRPMVLAYEQAQPQHGGSGAYYVLLRRKRA